MKRQPNAVISPPMTAVSLVDFRLHKPMTSGEIKSDTDVDIAPSQPAKNKNEIFKIETNVLD